MKIDELRINQKDKNILKELTYPKTIAQIAVILETSYNYASTKLKVWEAMGILGKLKIKREVKYFLNLDEIEI